MKYFVEIDDAYEIFRIFYRTEEDALKVYNSVLEDDSIVSVTWGEI